MLKGGYPPLLGRVGSWAWCSQGEGGHAPTPLYRSRVLVGAGSTLPQTLSQVTHLRDHRDTGGSWELRGLGARVLGGLGQVCTESRD